MDTWTINSGDLQLSGGTFATLSGPAKIQQDLGIASLTPYGSNRFHPRYGSVLGNYIGAPIGTTTQQFLRSEISRLITNYQTVQLNKMNKAIIAGYSSSYAPNDIVQSVTSIDVVQNYDSFSISITLQTMGGTSVTLSTAVTSSSTTASA
jgi:phage baseplate assembly protein W